MGYVEQKNHLFSYKLFKAQCVENQKEMIKIEVKDIFFIIFFFRMRVKRENISKDKS